MNSSLKSKSRIHFVGPCMSVTHSPLRSLHKDHKDTAFLILFHILWWLLQRRERARGCKTSFSTLHLRKQRGFEGTQARYWKRKYVFAYLYFRATLHLSLSWNSICYSFPSLQMCRSSRQNWNTDELRTPPFLVPEITLDRPFHISLLPPPSPKNGKSDSLSFLSILLSLPSFFVLGDH